MAENYVIAEGFTDLIGTDWPDTSYKFYGTVRVEERPCAEAGRTVFRISSRCYALWNTNTRFTQRYTVLIDGETAAESGELVFAYWVSDVPANTYGTVSTAVDVTVPATGGRHTVTFISSTSRGSYEFSAELHPLLPVEITKPEHTKSLSLHVGACNFESAKTMTESGYAYGSTEYSWEAVPDEGYELKPSGGSGILTEALVVAPEVTPMATMELYSGGEWQRYFLMLFTGGEWCLHQAHVYSDGGWRKYY